MPPKGKTPAPPRLPVASSDDDDAPGPDSTAISTQTPQWLAKGKEKERERELETFSEAQLQQIAELFHKLNLQSPRPSPDPPTRNPPDHNPPSLSSRQSLRASDIGYFHPDYREAPDSRTLVFTNVFVFTNRLALLAETRSEHEVIEAFPTCLRGLALFWHSTELTTKERATLARAPIVWLCDLLISRFKERPSAALRSLITSRFTFSDIRSGRTIRSHIQEMMSHARSAEFDKEYNIILLIWNSLDLTMRGHIDEPRREVTLAQFLTEVDAKWSIWNDMAHRPPAFSAALRPRQDQRLLPDIPDSTPPGTTIPLNSTPGPRKLGTKAYYIDHNGKEQAADLWDNVEQIG
jgi:hypothetical protein